MVQRRQEIEGFARRLGVEAGGAGRYRSGGQGGPGGKAGRVGKRGAR